MKTLSTIHGETLYVDDEDFVTASQYRWRLNRGGYALASKWDKGAQKVKNLFLHRLIAGARAGQMIDHRNRDKRDCTRANLREATASANSVNRTKLAGTTSRFIGVTWHRRLAKWQAKIVVAGESRYLGVFADETDAARAYDAAARDAFGEFANPNFREAR